MVMYEIKDEEELMKVIEQHAKDVGESKKTGSNQSKFRKKNKK